MILTRHTAPEMIRSKDNASGMPLLMQDDSDVMESLMDFCFSSPLNESQEVDDLTCDGRR